MCISIMLHRGTLIKVTKKCYPLLSIELLNYSTTKLYHFNKSFYWVTDDMLNSTWAWCFWEAVVVKKPLPDPFMFWKTADHEGPSCPRLLLLIASALQVRLAILHSSLLPRSLCDSLVYLLCTSSPPSLSLKWHLISRVPLTVIAWIKSSP